MYSASFLFIVSSRDIMRNLFTYHIEDIGIRCSRIDRIYGYIGKISLTVSLIIAKGKNYSIEGAFHSILIKNNQYSSVNKCNRSFINYISRHRHIFSFLSKSIHPTTRHHNLGLYNLSLQIFIVNFTRRVGFIKATKKLLVNMDPTINHIQVN